MKFLLTVIYFLFSFSAFSQIQNPLEYYTSSIDSQFKVSLNYSLDRLDNSQPAGWTYFVPSVGYDIINNRFSFSYSVSRFLTLHSLKNSQLIKIEDLKKINDREIAEAKLIVSNKYVSILELEAQYKSFLKSFNVLSQLAEIHHQQYLHNQLSLEVFLTKKLSYLSSIQNLENKKSAINKAGRELESLTNREVIVHLPQSNIYNYD